MTVPDKMISSEAFKNRWSSLLLTRSPQQSFKKKKGKKHLLKEESWVSWQNIRDIIFLSKYFSVSHWLKPHHNQLVLPYWTDDVKSATKLQTIEPLTEKTWGLVWVVFEVSNGGTSNSFHGELLSKKITRTAKTQLDGRHLLIGVYLQTWTALLSPKLPDKHALLNTLQTLLGHPEFF